MQLDIVSQLRVSQGRVLKKYYVDGIGTVGVVPNEPFSIRFTAIPNQRMQVRFAVDGTDIVTGQKANLDTRTPMFFSDGEGENVLELKAWVEDLKGGARFVFTDAYNAVTAHTHGDISAVGYISVAIFIEGLQLRGEKESKGPAVGAGEYISQHLEETEYRLKQPKLDKILQVRYLWWDELQTKLEAQAVQPQHPTGFEPRKFANLGNTPRLTTQLDQGSSEYSRFE